MILRGRAANGRVSGAYRGALDFRAGRVLRRRRRQLAAARQLPAGRRARRVAAVVADRGAQGPGRRGPHLRRRDDEARGDVRPLSRHALAGLRRRRRRGGLDEPGGRRDPRRGRHLQRPAGRDLLLLDLGRAHRGRREHAAGQRAAAVAEVGRRSLRRHLPAPPLGPDPDEPQAGRPQARLRRQGLLPRHRGRAPRPLAADRRGRRHRHARAHPRDRRAAARALRPVRLVGVLHLDHHRRRAAAGADARGPGRADGRHASRSGRRRCSAASAPSAPSPGACCRCCPARA